ncbi:MAG TPA: DEAD/DEAH box helicase [Conexibacter sp.]|jgi:ATP-dependent helicase YprA (DUF1998 family)|nr:DEAD/DEAH box helicase [Conexibacter sp.]
MGELLPTLAARSIRAGLLEYLDTTFALADRDLRFALADFLDDPTGGIFRGPYLRLRLPFRQAADGWRDALDWHPLDDGKGFEPYSHQAEAFARLSSVALGPERPRPLPTLVTTGTGSGKTEAFLYPILDHVRRAKARGIGGMKALVLYPMNALANDQAQRLAELITTHPSLAGVTAGLFVGERGSARTKVSSDGLITDRQVMRSGAPDILLTNYKMLDQMLLREADARIWAQSATSLQYLVLDEFHTYDGAQGTDVAMLLRRLGLTLKANGASGERPLGNVTPVATSATLGNREDPEAMLGFAETVFGEPFPADAVVTESRVSIDEWVGEGSLPDGVVAVDGRELAAAVHKKVAGLGTDPEPDVLAKAVLDQLYEDGAGGLSAVEQVRRHPLTRRLLEACADAAELRALAREVLPGVSAEPAEACLAAFAGLLSHLRFTEGRSMPSVEVHLWTRELTRIDREASTRPAFAWSDDGGVALGADDGDEDELLAGSLFPAIYCRHCGRSGWGVTLSPANNHDLDVSDADIRRDHANDKGKFRPLLLATREADDALRADGDAAPVENLRWLHVAQRQILVRAPEGEAASDGSVLPVLTHADAEANERSRSDTCPACQQRDGIRFLGSAIATQLSVALSTLFGSTNLDPAEKKTLVFTDSVQDAAHRAGFVQARSHSLTVRSVLREAVSGGARSLDTFAERVIERAGDDASLRYRLLPPDLAVKEDFEPFWKAKTLAKVPRAVRGRVSRRLAFDATLEFGLQSRLGRTLELTGTVAAQVEAAPGVMLAAARQALAEAGGQLQLAGDHPDTVLLAWVRGVLEHMRERGAIEHQWLKKLIEEDGNRYFIWRGRPRADGMPAFPTRRTAPAFPRVGPPSSGRENVLDSVAGVQSWYAQWAARSFKVSSTEGGALARLLLKRLAAAGVLTKTSNKAGAEVYGILPSAVIVEPVADQALVGRRHLLVCEVCQAQVPGVAVVVDQLDGAPCMVTRCDGKLVRWAGDPGNFYRRFFSSHEVQRVIAREHTSLLDDVVRVAYENGFKGKADQPDAPNVLVATPTLEMGIDIGDLSTVMLSSLPRSVASYLQRVGRAGRLTGSALNLAFVSGRGDQLPQLGDPTAMINGKVRPPATYVDAEEILRRQYLASLGDVEARSADGVHPERATGAIGSVDGGSYLHALAMRAETDAAHLEAFLGAFPTLARTAGDALRAWATREGDAELTSPLATRLLVESQRWRQQVELLGHRIAEIERSLPELRRLAELPVATDDDRQAHKFAEASLGLAERQRAELQGEYDGRQAHRSAEVSLRFTKRQRAELQAEYWISVLERAGIFPNYTLFDDSVTLDVGLSWLDPDTGAIDTKTYDHHRTAARALRDFAPGATFYAGGLQVRVNAVDLGNKGEEVRSWAFCATCGFSADVTERAGPASCPRCGSRAIGDVSQRIDVVELTRASSSMRRDEAMIDDARDDRIRERFQEVVVADFMPADVTSQWYVKDFGFGAKHVRDLRLKWLNLGRAAGLGATRLIGGAEVNAELFRVCSECGQLDRKASANSRYEHRPWCSLREAPEEDTCSIALSRTLRTEGLLLALPPMASLGSGFALPSLAAAIRLGLREHIGGAPDHLSLEIVVDPVPGDGRDNRDALLLHDLVPGGTGYLAELADAPTLRTILLRAYEIVRDCDCTGSGRLACHKCLLPFAAIGQTHLVSRAEAEKQLKDVLVAGSQAEVGPDGGPAWEVTEVAPTDFDHESRMEQKFRAALKERLQVLGAMVKAVPQTAGERWDIAVGGRTWTLEPQVIVGGCQPDFLLRCSDPSVPPAAIFCDGQRYHASPQHNRLADDAEKRQTLRDLGMLVLAFSWADLDGAEPAEPPWLDDHAARIVMGQPGIQLRPSHVDLMRGGPLDLLVAWIQSPDPEGLKAVGRALPFLLAVRAQQQGALRDGYGLATAALDLLDGGKLPHGDRSAWAWGAGAVVLLARSIPSTVETEVALVLDDAPSAVELGIKEPWQTWLRLSNLLGLRPAGTRITVRSLLAGSPAPSPVPVAGDGAPIDGAWREVIGQSTPDERGFLELLARADMPVPEYGPEVDGIPLGPSWLDRKITVDVDLGDAERLDLVRRGWIVVAMDVDAVRDALKAGAS